MTVFQKLFPTLLDEDEQDFRNLVVWLEDQKIRLYRIEDRKALRNTDSKEWSNAFKKVGRYIIIDIKKVSKYVQIEIHKN